MRPRQTIILGLLLLLPVLAFLFLYGFGRNHYALPTYLPERTDSVRTSAGGWQRDTVFHRVRPFRLAAAGRAVSSAELGQGLYVVQVLANNTSIMVPAAGKPIVLDEADRQVIREMARIQEKFRREPRVRLLTLVPYPEKADTDWLLEGLNEQYGTINGKWFMLTAGPATIDSLARYEFGLTALQPGHLPFRPGTEPGNLPLGRLVLVDRAGHVRGYYDGLDIHEIERLMTEINVLRYIYDDHR